MHLCPICNRRTINVLDDDEDDDDELVVQQICHIAMPEPNISAYQDVGGEFVVQQVVELLWARPLVVLYNMSVTGVHVVEFGTKQRRM